MRRLVGIVEQKRLFWCIPAGLFLWFVWPTPYEYTRRYPVVKRVNRFTGAGYLSTANGWESEKEIRERTARRFAEVQRQDEANAKAAAAQSAVAVRDVVAAVRSETQARGLAANPLFAQLSDPDKQFVAEEWARTRPEFSQLTTADQGEFINATVRTAVQ